MKKLALTALTLMIATSALADSGLKESFERILTVRPGTEFEIDNVNGGIVISGWDNAQVRIRATKRVEARDDATAREALRALKIEVRQDSRGVEVETIYPRKGDTGFMDLIFGNNVNASVTYEVHVPRSMNLSVDNVNGGIQINDIGGELDLDTTNGKISVARCSGAVDASTTNGAINVELTSVERGREMNFETTNGRITLAVPPTLAAEINAATTNGSVRSDLPLTTTRFSRTSIKGTLNGGGPEIKLRTTNGGIDIRSSSGSRPTS